MVDRTDEIMARIENLASPRRRWWGERLRVGAVAATVTALLLISTSLPVTDGSSGTASASIIARGVRAAARSIDGYTATYSIVERGWDARVPERRFFARLAYSAPESIRLRISDLTTYPDPSWPTNDVELVAGPGRWSLEATESCPTASLPLCSARPGVASPQRAVRTVVGRQPFDGTTPVPTDVIVPLDSVAGATGPPSASRRSVAGRAAYEIRSSYRQMVALVRSLQPGGSWRSFHPLDPVTLWIDAATWVPLRFELRAGSAPDRNLWAQRLGYLDEPGDLLLRVAATSFSSDAEGATFDVVRRGDVRDADFTTRAHARVPDWIVPSETASLAHYRSGVTYDGRWVAAYASGMTWLKLAGVRDDLAFPLDSEEVRVGNGFGYYRPATESSSRRLSIMELGRTVHLESNLSRAELIEVAASLPIRGSRAPARSTGPGASTIRRIEPPRLPQGSGYALVPEWLPTGYRPVTASITESRRDTTATISYRGSEVEFDGVGIRLTQSRSVTSLLPSSDEFIVVRVAGERGRWSVERGVLEWIDGDIYRAVTAPGLGLAGALRVARSLR